MTKAFFISDLHGKIDRYKKLFTQILLERPKIIFAGGDLLPSGLRFFSSKNILHENFIKDFLIPRFSELKENLSTEYPTICMILGNDDLRIEEALIQEGTKKDLWDYIHMKKKIYDDFTIFGYSFIPPTPFQLKDWEKYDISRYVDPGCISPEEGRRTVMIPDHEKKHSTIKKDLERLTKGASFEKSIFLFHAPPYKSNLDRAALDGKKIDHVPLDPHVGSIAIRKLIEKEEPYLTLHGHIHESVRLTGNWKEKIGSTICLSAAHDGPELALISFDLENPTGAVRRLL